jgi:hypothetical protein
MSTLGSVISETERRLLAGDRDQMNQLSSSMDGVTTTVGLANQVNGVTAGSYIAIDLEVMYVTAISGQNATVIRGFDGSSADAHANASIVYVNPKFSKWSIANEVNAEVRDLSAPPNGLFQAKSWTDTTKPVQKTYTIPSANTDILAFLDIRYLPPGPELRWDRISRWDIQGPMRDMPTSGTGGFTSGMAFRIEPPLYPGRTLRVTYAGPFTEFTLTGTSHLADDTVTTTGLPLSATDIPSLGAAARLMGVREAKRAFTENEVDTRRAGEVPPGSASKAAQTIMAILNERIHTEYLRLRKQWPDMM